MNVAFSPVAVKSQKWLLTRFHTLVLSNLPATVAPGGMSVKLDDPHTTDAKNNNQPTQRNTTADNSPAPKTWGSIMLRCMNEQIHKWSKWVNPLLPKLSQSDLERCFQMTKVPALTLYWISLGSHRILWQKSTNDRQKVRQGKQWDV